MTERDAFIGAYMAACKDRPADWNDIGHWYARQLWDAAIQYERAAQSKPGPGWIDADEQMPPIKIDAEGHCNCVLSLNKPGSYADYLPPMMVACTAWLHKGGKGSFSHWMPLPALPKG